MQDPEQTGADAGAIDPIALRRAFGTFVTGVTVITTLDADQRPRGMTANSFTSVSLDPPLVLVCVSKGAASYPAFQASENFAVNLLRDEQKDVSNLFASKSPEKFSKIDHDEVSTGAPVLTDCLSWFDCTVYQRVDAGDHAILIGRVQAFGTSPAAPLGFCRGQYALVKDPLPPGWLASHDMIVAYLVQANNQILLTEDGKGNWVLPTAGRRVFDGCLKLTGGATLDLLPQDAFLYSVFDIGGGGPGYVVYRAHLAPATQCAVPAQFKWFSLDEIPYEQIVAREIRSMLRRYVREMARGKFGIYIDSPDGGRVAMVDEAQSWTEVAGD